MIVALSDKAKGKRKASDDEEPLLPTPSPTVTIPTELTIRFTEGIADVTFALDGSYTVRDVKLLIREHRPTLTNRRLRLIFSGRLLQDDVRLQSWLTTHATPSSPTLDVVDENRSIGSLRGPHNVLIQCAIGPVTSTEEDESRPEQTAQLTPLRGFDRLAAAGISEADISIMRRQFHAIRGIASESAMLDVHFEEEADYEAHARTMEDQWLDSLDSGSSLASFNTPAAAGVIQGLFLGFFFPLLPFFFFFPNPREPIFWEGVEEWEDQPRSVIFSTRTQISIIIGFAVNVTFGIWRMLVSSS